MDIDASRRRKSGNKFKSQKLSPDGKTSQAHGNNMEGEATTVGDTHCSNPIHTDAADHPAPVVININHPAPPLSPSSSVFNKDSLRSPTESPNSADSRQDEINKQSPSRRSYSSSLKKSQEGAAFYNSSSDSGSEEEAIFEKSSILSPERNNSTNGTGGKSISHSVGSTFAAIRNLLGMSVYRNLLGAMTALYFTVTGVQYWGTSYLAVALDAPLPLANLLFILCAATGPTFGVFFGGWAVDVLGGYKGLRQRVVALELCSIFGILGCIFSIPITFLTNIYLAVFFLWALLFFGAAMLPACSGMLVSMVPRKTRPLSSSLSLIIFNLFGYSASLLLSGLLMQILDSVSYCDAVCSITWGFRLVLIWCGVSLIFLIQALLSSYKIQEDQQTLALRRSSIFSYVVDSADKRYNVYTSI